METIENNHQGETAPDDTQQSTDKPPQESNLETQQQPTDPEPNKTETKSDEQAPEQSTQQEKEQEEEEAEKGTTKGSKSNHRSLNVSALVGSSIDVTKIKSLHLVNASTFSHTLSEYLPKHTMCT